MWTIGKQVGVQLALDLSQVSQPQMATTRKPYYVILKE